MRRMLFFTNLAVIMVMVAAIFPSPATAQGRSRIGVRTDRAGAKIRIVKERTDGHLFVVEQKGGCRGNRVEQRLFVCADGPGKCPGTLDYVSICTLESELGFEITNRRSKRQLDLAKRFLQQQYDKWRSTGQLETLEFQVRARRIESLENSATILRDAGAFVAAESMEAEALHLRLFEETVQASLGPQPVDKNLGTAILMLRVRMQIPDDGCHFGDPCPGGFCGTIIGEGAAASCLSACIDCKRLYKPKPR